MEDEKMSHYILSNEGVISSMFIDQEQRELHFDRSKVHEALVRFQVDALEKMTKNLIKLIEQKKEHVFEVLPDNYFRLLAETLEEAEPEWPPVRIAIIYGSIANKMANMFNEKALKIAEEVFKKHNISSIEVVKKTQL